MPVGLVACLLLGASYRLCCATDCQHQRNSSLDCSQHELLIYLSVEVLVCPVLWHLSSLQEIASIFVQSAVSAPALRQLLH